MPVCELALDDEEGGGSLSPTPGANPGGPDAAKKSLRVSRVRKSGNATTERSLAHD